MKKTKSKLGSTTQSIRSNSSNKFKNGVSSNASIVSGSVSNMGKSTSRQEIKDLTKNLKK